MTSILGIVLAITTIALVMLMPDEEEYRQRQAMTQQGHSSRIGRYVRHVLRKSRQAKGEGTTGAHLATHAYGGAVRFKDSFRDV